MLRRMTSSELRLLELVGRGNFGSVHRGEWRGAPVVVKRVKSSSSSPTATSTSTSPTAGWWTPEAMQELLREAALHAALDAHPNVVKLCGSCVVDDEVWLVSEYIEGGSLRDAMDKLHGTWAQQVTPAVKIDIAARVAAGIWHMHNEGTLHCDLAARNILYDALRIMVKLCDFGLAKAVRPALVAGVDGGSAGPGSVFGAVKWMAPELLAGVAYESPTSDLYAFGIVLWEIWTGELPYPELAPLDAARQVLHNGLRPALPTDCPPGYALLVSRCLDSDPTQRPSAQDAYHALRLLA